MRSSFFIILAFLSLSVNAQRRWVDFSVEGGANYYNIALSPVIISGSCVDLRDLRIVDSKGVEVPYYVAPSVTQRNYADFEPYKVAIEQVGKTTQVIVEVGTKKINSMDFEIKNAQSDKVGTLSGSSDKKRWYVIKDRVVIGGVYGGDKTSRLVAVDFPMSDYRYYKLTIGDSTSSPLNIMRVGSMNYKSYTTSLAQLLCEPSTIEKSTKGKHSFVKLCYDGRYPLTRVDLYVSAPKYFDRQMTLYGVNGVFESYRVQGQGGDVCRLSLTNVVDTVTIDIDNMDDAPLAIDSIKTFIDAVSIVAHLDHGDYKLTFGDDKKAAPRYDLSFVAHLPDSLPVIETIGIDVQNAQTPIVETKKDSWNGWGKTILWVIIVLVIAQILRMTLKVAKKTENKE